LAHLAGSVVSVLKLWRMNDFMVNGCRPFPDQSTNKRSMEDWTHFSFFLMAINQKGVDCIERLWKIMSV